MADNSHLLDLPDQSSFMVIKVTSTSNTDKRVRK